MNHKESKKYKTRDLVVIALFAVLMAVCAWISIPSVVPFTMQTFAVYFALLFLGAKRGTVAVIVYLCLGLIGAPVYANFNSGIGTLLGATGGYMIGWIFSGLVMWLFEKLFGEKRGCRLFRLLPDYWSATQLEQHGLWLYTPGIQAQLVCGQHWVGV